MNRFLLWLMVFFSVTAFGQTVLDGDKVSRVAGERNYVLNPDARQNHTSNVTYSSVTASRSTTTPVGEAGAEFNLNMASNGTATWTVGTLSQGLRGGMCEARAKYRGASSTMLFQVRDGANVIAQVAATVDVTNSSQLSLPFPCGTTLNAFTFRVSAGTTAASAFEIADIYVGQVKAFGDAANNVPCVTLNPIVASNTQQNNALAFGGTTSAGTFGTVANNSSCMKRIGNEAEFTFQFRQTSAGTNETGEFVIVLPAGMTIDTTKAGPSSNFFDASSVGFGTGVSGGSIISANFFQATAAVRSSTSIAVVRTSNGTATETLRNIGSTLGNTNFGLAMTFKVPISQWSSVNSAVSPGSQNVTGSVSFNSGAATNLTTATMSTLNSSNFSTGALSGSAYLPVTGTCGTTNDFGMCVNNLPIGEYRVVVDGPMGSETGTNSTRCHWQIIDGLGNISGTAFTQSGSAGGAADFISSLEGLFSYSSFQSVASFRVRAARSSGDGNCFAIQDSGANTLRRLKISISRVNAQPTPVFITSPVRAAGTGVAPLSNEVSARSKGNLGTDITATSGQTLVTGQTTVTQVGRYRVRGMCRSSGFTGTITYVEASVGVTNCASPISESRATGFPSGGGNFWQSGITEQVVSGTTTFVACCRVDGTTGGLWSVDSYVEAKLDFDR